MLFNNIKRIIYSRQTLFTMPQKILIYISCYKNLTRRYSIEPPDWLGGRNIVLKSGRHKFPGFEKTLEERIKEINLEKSLVEGKNLGLEAPMIKRINKTEILKTLILNRRNEELERFARLQTLLIPLEELNVENECKYRFNAANHYSIFRDLLNAGDYFYPVVELKVAYPFDSINLTPVHLGNRIVPSEASRKPLVEYTSENSEDLYSLILVSPDSNLFHPGKEVIHWMVTNIKDADINTGTEIVKYLQPVPAFGTGYHRLIFLLLRHINKTTLNFQSFRLNSENCLDSRTFVTKDFFKNFHNYLIPVGLSFFQSSWDLSVRDVFYNRFSIEEPRYEYKHPVPYHPPPIKYPHKQPFDRYFDRYRDKRDLSEEVLKIKLKNTTIIDEMSKHTEEYESVSRLLLKECKYPLVHQHNEKDKPTWLKRKENMMYRKLEQFKQLND